MKGYFIDFEGGEKVGKTTQIRLAKAYLEMQGFSVVVSYEPGGGDPDIRKILLDKKSVITPMEELDLFCKDRALHVANVLEPALTRGAVVLEDRFEPSTIAYQGYGRRMHIPLIRRKSAAARKNVLPDLIILLDADPKVVLLRDKPTSRFDAETIEFHNRVRKGFLKETTKNALRWRIIDAAQSKERVWQCVRANLNELLDIKHH